MILYPKTELLKKTIPFLLSWKQSSARQSKHDSCNTALPCCISTTMFWISMATAWATPRYQPNIFPRHQFGPCCLTGTTLPSGWIEDISADQTQQIRPPSSCDNVQIHLLWICAPLKHFQVNQRNRKKLHKCNETLPKVRLCGERVGVKSTTLISLRESQFKLSSWVNSFKFGYCHFA